MSDVPPPADLKKVVKYIANLKKWLKKEHQWEREVRTEVNRLRKKVGGGTPPAPIKPPPRPPFQP